MQQNVFHQPNKDSLNRILLTEYASATGVILRLAWLEGLTRDEISSLTWEQIDFDANELDGNALGIARDDTKERLGVAALDVNRGGLLGVVSLQLGSVDGLDFLNRLDNALSDGDESISALGVGLSASLISVGLINGILSGPNGQLDIVVTVVVVLGHDSLILLQPSDKYGLQPALPPRPRANSKTHR